MQGTITTAAEQRRPHASTGRLERLRAHLQHAEQQSVRAVLAQERRRIAADVHDLVMQDLALALATARMLADQPGSGEHAGVVVAAAERALAGARQVLDGLAHRDRVPVVEALGASVRAAARHVALSFHAEGVPAHVQPDQPTLDALVHIGREAVTNAVKHAAPSAVEVVLEHVDEWRLRVRDNGRGFAAADLERGFGLGSMRSHVDALGGSLQVTSVHEAGTTVEVALP